MAMAPTEGVTDSIYDEVSLDMHVLEGVAVNFTAQPTWSCKISAQCLAGAMEKSMQHRQRAGNEICITLSRCLLTHQRHANTFIH